MMICSTKLQLCPACCLKRFPACRCLCICKSVACNNDRATIAYLERQLVHLQLLDPAASIACIVKCVTGSFGIPLLAVLVWAGRPAGVLEAGEVAAI